MYIFDWYINFGDWQESISPVQACRLHSIDHCAYKYFQLLKCKSRRRWDHIQIWSYINHRKACFVQSCRKCQQCADGTNYNRDWTQWRNWKGTVGYNPIYQSILRQHIFIVPSFLQRLNLLPWVRCLSLGWTFWFWICKRAPRWNCIRDRRWLLLSLH